MKYTTKPAVINAWQFTGKNLNEIRLYVGEHKIDVDAYRSNFIWADEQWSDVPEGIVALVWVAPSHQWAGVKTGDYIVEDSAGDFYPCDRQIFERKYSPIEENVIEASTEVKVTGVITNKQIDDAIGRSIQQSSRFR